MSARDGILPRALPPPPPHTSTSFPAPPPTPPPLFVHHPHPQHAVLDTGDWLSFYCGRSHPAPRFALARLGLKRMAGEQRGSGGVFCGFILRLLRGADGERAGGEKSEKIQFIWTYRNRLFNTREQSSSSHHARRRLPTLAPRVAYCTATRRQHPIPSLPASATALFAVRASRVGEGRSPSAH